MASFIRFYKYIVFTYLLILAGTIFVYAGYEKLYDVYPSQFFYLNNCSYGEFKEKYEQLYKSITTDSLNHFIFHEPYKGAFEEIKYIRKESLKPKSPDNKKSDIAKDYWKSVSCNYFIPSIDGYVAFCVTDGEQVKVVLYHYNPSFSKYDKNRWKKDFYVNGRKAPYKKNKEVICAFENEVLNKITPYERDYMQGYIRQYVSFFERYFLYYLAFFIFLPIPLIVRFLVQKIGD